MKKYKILIVDDSTNWRKSIARMIKRNLGITCLQASDGKEAINRINIEAPDLVLLDFEMPEMNGLEVIKHIKNSDHSEIKNTPVIMLTGVAEKSRIMQLMQMEIVDYILKPIDEASTMKKIKSVLPDM